MRPRGGKGDPTPDETKRPDAYKERGAMGRTYDEVSKLNRFVGILVANCTMVTTSNLVAYQRTEKVVKPERKATIEHDPNHVYVALWCMYHGYFRIYQC